LYFGASHEKPVNGMFSFFPCLPSGQDVRGFARPVIEMKDLITNNLCMGRKATMQPDIGAMEKQWQCVVAQVEAANLRLGVWTQMPEHK